MVIIIIEYLIHQIKKNDILELNENNDKNLSNWDSSFSLISFMNNLLNKPHSFILNFTNKFLIVNLQKDKGSYITFMKEFGLIFFISFMS